MSVTRTKDRIKDIYRKRIQAVYALALNYASIALNYFRSVQPATPETRGKFWTNRTGQAAARMFTDARTTSQFISWYMAHGVQYGVYLELANNRRFQAINPIIQRYAGRFIGDVRKIYAD